MAELKQPITIVQNVSRRTAGRILTSTSPLGNKKAWWQLAALIQALVI